MSHLFRTFVMRKKELTAEARDSDEEQPPHREISVNKFFSVNLLLTLKHITVMAKGICKYVKYQNNVKLSSSYGKWYARLKADKVVSFPGLVEHMAAHNSPFTEGTITAVLTDMLACIKELILDGKSVRLGDLGILSVQISSTPADTAADWSPSTNVKNLHLVVRNTKSWANSELRKDVSFQECDEYTVADGETAA